MQVLVVLAGPPHPEGDAPSRGAVGLLDGLVANGVQVRAIAARQHFARGQETVAPVPVEVVDVPLEPPLLARARGLRRPLAELSRGPFDRRVRELAAAADVVHLDQTVTAWCAHGMPVPRLLNVHYRLRLDRDFGFPGSRQWRQGVEFARLERAAVRRHRYLTANGPDVAETLRHPGGADPVVVPFTIDPAGYRRSPPEDPPAAGLIGTGSWAPTAAALRQLADVVWPEVRRSVPEARLLVAGRGTDALRGLAGVPGLDLVGEVPSAARFLNRLSLLLYPLPRGSGMKVKVLESLACGVPVVTTPPGAIGFGPTDAIVVETTPQGLAAAAGRILGDPAEQRERASAARRLFEELHRPEVAVRPLLPLYQRMLEERS